MAVTPETIAVALGRTAPSSGSVEFEQWSMWISDARLIIEKRLGSLTELDQDVLDYVVREAVVAHVRNPDNATQVSYSVDDASSQRTYKSSRGRVEILDEWWAMLSPDSTAGKAFEVDTMPTDAGVHGVDYWWSSPIDRVWF